ncbi:hypothetical protein [Yinghuangia seranimata]|uniref:hypothetical protein n=1 Tax=Yinghuangia seranimata TaxID=408067 RepID=UPI00248C2557|nr:hypothetical protein [Yinghuangia seranimata]MDI2132907.1 hypothetical protein [Yinghuangia seranimata]
MRGVAFKGGVLAVGGVLLAGALTGCQGGGGGGPLNGSQVKGGKVPPAMVGSWSTGSVSMVEYQDAMTGSFAPPSGTNIMLEIKADGTYSSYGLLQMSMYSCTTTLFTQEAGGIDAQGGQITFTQAKLTTSMKDSCRKSGNFDNRDGEKKTKRQQFQLTKDQSGPVLRIIDGQDGTIEYRPAKK